jgi:hypothetical protein
LLVRIGKPAVRALVAALTRDFSGGGRTATGILNGAARIEVIKALVEIGTPEAGSNDVLLALAGVERGDPFPAVRTEARQARAKLQRKE